MTRQGFFSSCTRRLIARWRRVSYAAPKPPVTPESWSHWTPGYPAGGRAIFPPPTSPQLRGMCLSNYISDPVFRAKVDADIDADPPRNAVLAWVSNFGNSLTWDDLPCFDR